MSLDAHCPGMTQDVKLLLLTNPRYTYACRELYFYFITSLSLAGHSGRYPFLSVGAVFSVCPNNGVAASVCDF